MKTRILFSLFICTMVMSCSSCEEKTINDKGEQIQVQDSVINAFMDTDIDSSIVANDTLAELQKQKLKHLKEGYDKSPNKGKSCEEILSEYEEVVDQIRAGTNLEEADAKLAAWALDPIFLSCKSKPEFKQRFDELEERMYDEES